MMIYGFCETPIAGKIKEIKNKIDLGPFFQKENFLSEERRKNLQDLKYRGHKWGPLSPYLMINSCIRLFSFLMQNHLHYRIFFFAFSFECDITILCFLLLYVMEYWTHLIQLVYLPILPAIRSRRCL